MKIVLTDATTIEVTNIVPHAGGLIIDTPGTSLAEIEQQITAENIDTITCMEGDTAFARYYNQQLDCISKDGRGVHIKTKYKVLLADKDVSKQLVDLQNTILSIGNDLASVQSVQDVQLAAIADLGDIVSQSMMSDVNGVNGKEAAQG